MRFFAFFAALALAGCGQAGPAPKTPAIATPPAPVKDLSSLLPPAGRVSASTVEDHLLGMIKMPGGTVGDYEAGGKKYRLFVIETEGNQNAAFLLVDLKDGLANPVYIAHMGGYFGTGKAGPVYAFAKQRYLAGVTGLSEDDADPIARVLAARLK